jgi:hypothetical protein
MTEKVTVLDKALETNKDNTLNLEKEKEAEFLINENIIPKIKAKFPHAFITYNSFNDYSIVIDLCKTLKRLNIFHTYDMSLKFCYNGSVIVVLKDETKYQAGLDVCEIIKQALLASKHFKKIVITYADNEGE